MPKQISLAEIRIDGGTQMRQQIDYPTVDDYANAFASDADMPAVVVFYDGATNWLADGFHRWHGAKKAGLEKIKCDVRSGSQRDAILFACGANTANGLRRTNADKRVAVMRLLHDSEWRKMSDGKIAELCGVSQPFVSDQRRQVKTVMTSKGDQPPKVTGKDGKSYPVKKPSSKPSKATLHVPPIDEMPSKKIEIPFQDVGVEIGHNRTEALLKSGCAVLVDKFADEREWVRTLHDLAISMRKKQTKLDIDKAVIVHNLTTAANDIAEAIQSAEEAA